MPVVSIITPEDLAKYAPAWDRLAFDNPLLGSAWLGAWWTHYAPTLRASSCDAELGCLAVVDEGAAADERLIGFAPWYATSRRGGRRTIHFLGGGEVCTDYLRVLSAAGREQQVAVELADWLADRAGGRARNGAEGWERLSLADVDGADQTTRRLLDELPKRGLLVHERVANVCWRLSLPDNWEDYLASLSRARRKLLRRAERTLFDTGRAVQYMATDDASLKHGWRILLDLHNRRWRSRRRQGCFASPVFRDFHEDVSRKLFERGQLRLAWTELDAQPIAADYLLVAPKIMLAYQSGIAPEALDYSPGMLNTLATIRDALPSGFRHFDMLRGNEPYKRAWGARPRSNLTVDVLPARAVDRMRQRLWVVRDQVKDWTRPNRAARRDQSIESRDDSQGAECGLRVSAHRQTKTLASIAPQWNRLAGDVPFVRWEWLEAWARLYAPADSLRTLEVREGRRLVGLAPWYVDRGALGGRTLRFLGSGEVCSDYLTILADQDRRAAVVDRIADWLSDEAAGEWDSLVLSGAMRDDPAVTALARAMSARGHRVHTRRLCNTWRLDLPATWDEYLDRLSKSRRDRVRVLLRRSFGSGNAVVRRVSDVDELAAGFDILSRLHQKRRQSLGESGCFSSRRFSEFHRLAMRRLFESGMLRLDWMEWKGRPAAAAYRIAGGNTLYFYQCGFEPDLARERPGWLDAIAMLRWAIEQRFRHVDFLRGDEPYKVSWRAEPCALVEVRVAARRFTAEARHAAWLGGQQVKAWAKRHLGSRQTNQGLEEADAETLAAGSSTQSHDRQVCRA